MMWRIPAALLAAMAVPAIASAETPAVDPAIAGVWTMPIPAVLGGATLLWEIRPNGTYDFHSQGGLPAQAHSGIVTFNGGYWSMTATAGFMPWVDGGSYQLDGQNVLVTTGMLGTGVWQRAQPVSDAGASAPAAERLPVDLPALLKPALTRASDWRADAVPTDIRVSRSSIDPRSIDLAFDFYSPSARAGATVVAGVPLEEALAERSLAQPTAGRLPTKFVDLAAALSAARQHGMTGSLRAAELAVRQFDPTRMALVWQITTDDGRRATIEGLAGSWLPTDAQGAADRADPAWAEAAAAYAAFAAGLPPWPNR
jgi:hypothetical protein